MPGFEATSVRPSVASLTKRQVLSSMYAVIETGGKQYKVEIGSVLFVEKLVKRIRNRHITTIIQCIEIRQI